MTEPRQNLRDHDELLERQAESALFRLARNKRERKIETEREAASYEQLKRRKKTSATFYLPRPEFTKRARFRDANGNSYAPALSSDDLYKALRRRGLVDSIDDPLTNFPKERKLVVDQDGTTGTLYGSMVMFASMTPDGLLHKWPKGDVEFVDPSDDSLYTAKIASGVFRGKSKGGYVIMNNVIYWGRMADPREFFE